MDDYTHLYGLRTPYKENGLEVRVRYPLYIVIYCKRVHYTADSLVWGSLRLAPIIKEAILIQVNKPLLLHKLSQKLGSLSNQAF